MYNRDMIILFGMAGAGKGTQGEILARDFHWKWLSVGQVIRETGKYVATTNAGGLIPDEDVVELMTAEIAKAKQEGFENIILDGYPRNLWQAEWLMQNGWAKQIELAVILEVPKEELMWRLEIRGREDDKNLETVNKRFAVFEQNICSMTKLLIENGIKVEKIDATGEISVVTERIKNLFNEKGVK